MPSAGRYWASLSARWTPPPPAGGKYRVTRSTFTRAMVDPRSAQRGEGVGRGGDRGVDLGVAVRAREEPRLELRGRQVDAALEHRTVERGEAARVRELRVLPVADRPVREEEARHGARARRMSRDVR